MSPDERADLLSREAAWLGVSRADSLRCPLCGAQVPEAWTLDAEGRPAIPPGPVKCPQCDFRLDGCNAFQLSRSRLEKSGVRWPNARRAALLRLIRSNGGGVGGGGYAISFKSA